MTPIHGILQSMGMSQYVDRFCDEGFDTWETLVEITESDFEALGVKLGHRRRLQRAIVIFRERPKDGFLAMGGPGAPPQLPASVDSTKENDTPGTDSATSPKLQQQAKRKYRRHPKPDEHAPERPPSAYVIFSNQMRETIRNQKLTFTEIAKLVGERWQSLSPEEKEPCERQAQRLKEHYYNHLAQYKQTPQYESYQRYLADFRAKHCPSSASSHGNKRVKTSDGTPDSIRGNSPARTEDILLKTDESSSRGEIGAASPTSPTSVPDTSVDHKLANQAAARWRPGLHSPASTICSPTEASPRSCAFSKFPRRPSNDNRPSHDSSVGYIPGGPSVDPSYSSSLSSSKPLHQWQYAVISAKSPADGHHRSCWDDERKPPPLTRDDTRTSNSPFPEPLTSDFSKPPESHAFAFLDVPSARVLPVPPGLKKAQITAHPRWILRKTENESSSSGSLSNNRRPASLPRHIGSPIAAYPGPSQPPDLFSQRPDRRHALQHDRHYQHQTFPSISLEIDSPRSAQPPPSHSGYVPIPAVVPPRSFSGQRHERQKSGTQCPEQDSSRAKASLVTLLRATEQLDQDSKAVPKIQYGADETEQD